MNPNFKAEEYVTPDIMEKYQLIKDRLNSVRKYSCRNLVLKMLDNPELIVLDKIDEKTGSALYENGLIDNPKEFEKYFLEIKKRKRNDFISSPGSELNDHHSYPGGLVYHTATNIELALGVADVYGRIYGLKVDRELLITAMAFHDIAKVFLFSWDNQGTYPDEYQIAGTETHHILSISEAILKEFPFEVVKGMAFCHASFERPEKELEKYLAAAYIITGKAVPKNYILEPEVEDMICLYADSDGFISKWAVEHVVKILMKENFNRQKIYKFLSLQTEYSIFK